MTGSNRGDVADTDQGLADSHDLSASLTDLAALISGSMPLNDLLSKVATFAVNAVPHADGAGITLLRLDRADDIVAARSGSAEFVEVIDEIQYHVTREGPCITAVQTGETVIAGNLSGDGRWPRFGPRAGRAGVHSALSLPLILPDAVIGAINVYAHEKDVFDSHAAELGALFATPAAVAVHNAQVLAQAQLYAGQLQQALASRPVIDQAIGILRARSGGTSEEAFARLRTISQNENVKVVVIAQRIVDEAVRRARARQSDGPAPA